MRRLRALAEVIPGAIYGEATVDASQAQVWELVRDMDTSMPELFPNFLSWHTVERRGEHLRAHATGRLGLRGEFEVNLRPGLCVMQDRRFFGGVAAAADGPGRTRLAVLAGLRGPGRHLRFVLHPLGGTLARRVGARLD